MAGSTIRRIRAVLSNWLRRRSTLADLMSAQIARTSDLLELQIDAWRRTELQLSRYSDPRSLNRFEQKVYSQDGGDGILREIRRRIGEGGRFFVEFGVGGGLENNTAILAVEGWSGVWIEGDPAFANQATATFGEMVNTGQLIIVNSFITAANIEQLLADAGAPAELDFLSIDIDGNDYWIWSAIQSYRPRVVEIEYNSMFPPGEHWIMKYNPEHRWNGDSYFGASLSSLEELGRKKGYALVACTLAGTNAFFVRSDLIGEEFEPPFTAEACYQPPRYFMVNERAGHPRTIGPHECNGPLGATNEAAEMTA